MSADQSVLRSWWESLLHTLLTPQFAAVLVLVAALGLVAKRKLEELDEADRHRQQSEHQSGWGITLGTKLSPKQA